MNASPSVIGDGLAQAASILEDAATIAGQAIGILFADLFSDSDGDELAGIAVTANGSSAASGQWQYFDGAQWLNIAAAAPDAAILLSADTLLRFLPAPDFNGAAPPLIVHLIDDTIAPFADGDLVDLSGPAATGGSTAYSAATAELGGAVASVNDAPTIAGLGGDTVAYAEGGAPVRLDLGGDASAADVDQTGFQVTRIAAGFVEATFVTGVPDGSGRVFVLEKAGLIKILDPATGTIAATPYLDLVGTLSVTNEDGLVGFLTAPDYATSGISYVFLVNAAGAIEVRKYQTDPGSPDHLDAGDYTLVLTIDTPTDLHNGGFMEFGPDGYLYIGVGDGNVLPDFPHAQNPNSLLGKILRIDVSADDFPADPNRNYAIPDDNPFASSGGAPEVWALGLRNPFRASFDPATGNLIIGDVGQGLMEEIDVIPAGVGGLNFGWPLYEGTLPYFGGPFPPNYTPPAATYEHGTGPFAGNSVIGGYVYQGPIEALQGQYIFGDFIRGNVWAVPASLLVPGAGLTAEDFTQLNGAFFPDVGKINLISSFGQDEAGNFYVVDFIGGEIFRLAPTATGNFAGGRLEVAISEHLVAGEDRLSIDVSPDTDVTLSNGTNVGSEVRVGGVVVGVIAFGGTGVGGNMLVINLSGGATPELIATLMSAVAYSNSNLVNPSTETRTITFTIVDGAGTANGGEDRVVATTQVTITDINDAPDGGDLVKIANQDTPYVLQAAHFGFSDVDGDGLGSVIVTSLPGHGTLFHDADGPGGADPVAVIAGQEISVADIAAGRLTFRAAPGETGAPYTSFTFQVRDDRGTDGGGVDLDPTPNTLTFEVVPLGARNDMFDTDEASSVGGGVSLFVDNGAGADTDAGGAPLTVTAVQGQAGSVGQDILLASGAKLRVNANGTFTYDPNGAFNWLTEAGSGAVNLSATDSFTYTISDGSTATVQVHVSGLISAGDLLLGDASANMITGTPGGDFINGEGGADQMTGLGGNDSYVVDTLLDQVIEAEDGGYDTIYTGLTYVLAAGASIEALSTVNWAATDAINLTGNERANALFGNAGANVLSGGGGTDLMTGFGGDDVYHIDSADDLAVEAEGGGNDIVYTSTSYNLRTGTAIEILSAANQAGTEALVLTGNDFANVIFGNAGNNILNGVAGADTAAGFAGDDVYLVDNPADVVIEAAGEGFDVVYAYGSFALGAGASVEILSTANHGGTEALDLAGNELANILYGNAGANVLNGNAGADTMAGFGGDDTYFIDHAGDLVFEATAGGNDTIYVALSYALDAAASIETLSATNHAGTEAINLTGNDLANALYGNAGVNVLNGGNGADVMTGFGGDDVYHVGTVDDLVIEAAGGGNDIVYTSVSYNLRTGTAVETLSAANQAGTEALVLTGNDFANAIFGNAGNNVLNGVTGADTMTGFAGDDIYLVDNAGDVVVELAGGGSDAVYAYASYALNAGAAAELLSAVNQLGTEAFDFAGNEFGQTIYGNAGANTIDGGRGADQLWGFGGQDRFAFTTALGGGNIDTLGDFSVTDDTIILDDAVFAGLALGELARAAFVIGIAADANDRIIYNVATGALLFDPDGTGAAAAVQFATLQPGLALTAADFLVI